MNVLAVRKEGGGSSDPSAPPSEERPTVSEDELIYKRVLISVHFICCVLFSPVNGLKVTETTSFHRTILRLCGPARGPGRCEKALKQHVTMLDCTNIHTNTGITHDLYAV